MFDLIILGANGAGIIDYFVIIAVVCLPVFNKGMKHQRFRHAFPKDTWLIAVGSFAPQSVNSGLRAPVWARLSHGLPGGSDDKESTCSVGDLGSIPGLGKSHAEGHGNPL